MVIEFDEHALHSMVTESDAFHAAHDGIHERARAVVAQVATTHAGQPHTDVDAELRSKLAAAGIEPRQPGFGQIVQAISDAAPVV